MVALFLVGVGSGMEEFVDWSGMEVGEACGLDLGGIGVAAARWTGFLGVLSLPGFF